MIDILWFLITWGTFVAIACAVLAGLYLYNRVDEEIRALAEAQLAEIYPDLRVAVGSAKLVERRGFEVRGVSLATTNATGAREELLFAERVSIACRPTAEDLMAGRLEIRSVTLRGVRLQIARDARGGWTVRQLIRRPTLQLDPPPRVLIEGGVVEVVDSLQSPPALYTLRDVNLTLTPEQSSTDSPRYRLDATFSGDHLQRSTVAGIVLPHEARFVLKGQVPRLLISPELRQALPRELAAPMERLGTLRGGTSVDFILSRDATPEAGWELGADAKLQDGFVADPRIPEPLTDVQAELHVDLAGVDLKRFAARYGGAQIELTGAPAGNSAPADDVLAGSVRDLNLDTKFASLLPEKLRKVWQDFQPKGLIDAEFRFVRVDGAWQPDITCQCRDVSLQWRKFPVPCRAVQGEIHVTPGGAAFNLAATSQDEPVTIAGHVLHPGPDWTGWVTVATNAPQGVAALLPALPQKAQGIVQDLSPQGRITGQVKVLRESPTQPPRSEYDLTLVHLDVRHRAFPYPIRDISGHLTCRDNVWQFQQLKGVNDGAQIRCEGHWQPTPAGGQLVLNVSADHVPLDEELRQALPPSSQQIWAQLRPRGTLDTLHARLVHTKQDGVQLDLQLHQLANSETSELREISIQPTAFPYRIDEITGHAQYRNHRVDFQHVRGRHGDTTVSTHGHALPRDDGSWRLAFDELSVDHLTADRDFIGALPGSLARAVEQLRIDGPVHLGGRLIFQRDGGDASPLRAEWQMRANVDHAHVNCGLPLRDLAGAIHLQGVSQDDRFYSRGQLELESVMLQDIHFSHVRGPIWFNDKEVRLGSWAESPSANERADRVAARALGGNLQADAQVLLDDTGQFRIHVDLADASLLHALRELAPNTQPVRGIARANLKLAGTKAGSHTLQGQGEVHLRQANLYELPQILSLLKSLRSGSVDRSAFDSGNVAFRVNGEHIYLDRIDLIGDSMTLKGVGELNTRREINVDFYTILGRENAYVPAMRKLFGMTNGRFLQIHVTGPLEDPEMVREALPALNETLEQLFPELTQVEAAQGQVR